MRCPYHALAPARNLSMRPTVASQAGSDANAANGCGAASGCDLQAARAPPAGPAASSPLPRRSPSGMPRRELAGTPGFAVPSAARDLERRNLKAQAAAW